MDKKSSRNVLSFPNVYFLIDDFESAWDNVTLSQGQEFCVELVVEIDPKFLQMYSRNASDANGSEHDSSNGTTPVSENLTTIFLGASSFSQIQEGSSTMTCAEIFLGVGFDEKFLSTFFLVHQFDFPSSPIKKTEKSV